MLDVYVHNKRRKRLDELIMKLWRFYKLEINLKSFLKETGSQPEDDTIGATLTCFRIS